MFSVVETAARDRRGDEALDQVGAGAGIGRRDGDRPSPRPPDTARTVQVEDALERRAAGSCSASTVDRTGRRMKRSERLISAACLLGCSAGLFGSMVLSTVTGMPLERRFCPAVTTSSPALIPSGDLDLALVAPAGLDEHLTGGELAASPARRAFRRVVGLLARHRGAFRRPVRPDARRRCSRRRGWSPARSAAAQGCRPRAAARRGPGRTGPGVSWPSGLATSPRTETSRVAGSILGSMPRIVPLKGSSSAPPCPRRTVWPDLQAGRAAAPAR